MLTATSGDAAGLDAYVPRFGRGQRRPLAEEDASLMVADVSGYTRLTERFASSGRGGAEELTAVVNRCFAPLIDEVRVVGGDVVRFGGDALFIVITGERRLERAAVLAAGMQRVVRSLPVVVVPGAAVRLRMSVGLHDGSLLTYRWHGEWTELVPLGRAVSETLRLESAAAAGEVRVSDAVADKLGPGLVRDGCLRLAAANRLVLPEISHATRAPGGAEAFVPVALRRMLASGLRPEHRAVSVAFVLVSGTDELTRSEARLRAELDPVFAAVAAIVERFSIIPLSTDVAPDGVKIVLATGVPTASENDEDRLLAAVQALVEAVPGCRAGVHTGVVYCADVGHPRRRTFTVMGDAVNMAARLLGKAARGQVLATDALLDAVSESFETTAVEPFRMKGKSALQRAVIVRGRLPVEPAISETPFRGRRAELRQLMQQLQGPGAIEVVGAAGVGVSRLVREALRSLVLPETLVRATPEDDGAALSVARRALVALGGDVPPDDPAAGYVAAIDSLVLALADSWRPGRLGEGSVLVVDRVHLADEASVVVFRALEVVARDVGCRLVIIGRSGAVSFGEPIELGPLDPDDIRMLTIDASTRPLSDVELDTIVVRSAGNPRFAQQLARLPGSDADLPVSMEALVTSRLDRLPGSIREVVREAALIGSTVQADFLAAVTGRSAEHTIDALTRARGVVSKIDDRVFAFDDESLREVAAGGHPVSRRRPIHRRAAEELARDAAATAAQIAHHVFEAADDEGTWRWAAEAARQAHALGASASAAKQAARALDAGRRLGRPARELIDAAAIVAEAATRAGLLRAADAALAEAITLETRARARAEFLVLRARIAQREFRWRSARAYLAAAERVATGSAAIAVAIELGWVHLQRGHFDEAFALAEDAARAARRARRRDLESRALLLALEIGVILGRADDTDDFGRRALETARRSGDDDVVARAANNVAVGADNCGHWPDALALYDEAAARFGALGDVGGRALIAVNRATILNDLGDADEIAAAVPDLRRILAAAQMGAPVALCEMLLARSAARSGQPSGAVERAEKALQQMQNLGQPEPAFANTTGLIEVLLLARRHREAFALANQMLLTVDEYGPENMCPITVRRLQAMALAGLGHFSNARSVLIDALRRADEVDALPERCFVRWALAQLPGGLPGDELAVLENLEHDLAPISAVLFRTAWTDSGIRPGR